MTEAWVTLATTDAYALGALVLAHSLKASKTTRKLHCMITENISQTHRDELRAVFDEVSIVDVLNSEDTTNLALIGRPDLGVTFTKLHCWRLMQYTKCVFVDADCLALQNCDELFDREEFSAAADIGWPDCFNSGVFVFVPSEETYSRLLQFATECGSFDGGDQGLLNMFYHDWRDKPAANRLPFIYNMTSGAIYTYAAAYKRFGTQVKIVHFLGALKPWQQRAGGVHFSEHLSYWWNLFSTRVAPNLPSSNVSSWWCSECSVQQCASETLPSCTHSSSSSSTPFSPNFTESCLLSENAASSEEYSPKIDVEDSVEMSHIKSVENSNLSTASGDADEDRKLRGLDVDVIRRQVPNTTFPTPPPCTRVYRIDPPYYQSWTPLRHIPKHVADKMKAFSPAARAAAEGSSPEPLVAMCAEEGVPPPTQEERLKAWEVGHPDYLGRDAFENIQKRIDEVLKK